MKTRISITIDDKIDKKINDFLKQSKFRNKSHIVEIALEEFIKKEEVRDDKNKRH